MSTVFHPIYHQLQQGTCINYEVNNGMHRHMVSLSGGVKVNLAL
jgi:hypothetical protein